MNIAEHIIVPLDVPTKSEAIALINKLPQVLWWKVGLELFVSAGTDILTLLKERQKRIFLDLKFHDIPNTIAGACRSALAHEVDLITIHCTGGKNALKAAVEVVQHAANHPKLLGITLLTSLNSRDLAFDFKISLELPEYVLQMALLAQESGLDGVVCSPQEVEQLRQICGHDFLLICPGVRPKWSVTGDQRRVMTPAQAIGAGADYLVIGRPITQATDPVEAWEKIASELTTI